METVSVTCNHCGAPLDVAEDTRFVTCGFCGSRLEVHRSGGAVYSEVLERVSRQTEQIAGDVEVIRLQNELERLDREWMMERERYMVRGKHGRTSVPSATGGVIAAVVAAGFGIFWTIIASSMDAPSFFVLFGVFFVVVAIVMGAKTVGKAGAYENAHNAYQAERRVILQKIDELQ